MRCWKSWRLKDWHSASGGARYEHTPQDQRQWVNALAPRDHSVLIGTFFLRITQRAGTSLGGLPCGVQDRVRQREE